MFTSLFRSEDAGDRSPGSDFWFNPVGRASSSGVRVTADSAMRYSAVWACVQVLSQSMAVLPFEMYRRRPDGGRTPVTDHWLYRLIARQPNRFQTPYAWRQTVQAHLCFRGNAFNRIIEDGRGGIAELLPMHPDRVTLELVGDSWRYRYRQADGTDILLPRQSVWHLKGLADDGMVGLSPIEYAREAIGGGIAAERYANKFFANDARPTSGWVEMPGKFANDEARRSFRSQLQDAQAGMNRGKVLVLDQGAKWNDVGMSNADAQFIESRRASKADIASIFRIPPHKIGELSRSTNNNIEAQGLEFWTDTMMPWTANWGSSIECDLLGAEQAEAEGLEACFAYTPLLTADTKTRSEYLSKMVLAGILTRNEAREVEGYNPIDGLSEPLVPQNERGLNEAPTTPPAPKRPADDADDGEGDDNAQAVSYAARILALGRSSAERVARKEMADLQRAARSGTPAAAVYEGHAAFVAQALGVPIVQAEAYCAARLASLEAAPADEATSAKALQLLAITGEFTP